jgi:phage shock protein A
LLLRQALLRQDAAMRDHDQLISKFRAQADAYDEQARLALSRGGVELAAKAAASYRRLADLLESDPPGWAPRPKE